MNFVTYFVLAASFALGLTVGSFLNVVVIRGARKERLGGRSYCESCGTLLSPKELIPVLSFLIQKGRCRHCGTALSRQYPLVELGTAVLYGLGAAVFLIPPSFDLNFWVVSLLLFAAAGAAMAILVSDLRFQIIPDSAIIVIGIIGAARIFSSWGARPWRYDIGTAVVLAAFLALIWLLSRGKWMGLGDAKLLLVTSLAVGFPAAAIAFLLAFWIGGATGALLLLTEQKTLQSLIPFGPFILLGSVLAYFFADAMIESAGLAPIISWTFPI